MNKTEKLIRMYTDSGYTLLALIRTLEDSPTKTQKERILKQITAILTQLSEGAASTATEIVEMAYKSGSNEASTGLIEQGIKSKEELVTTLSTVIHTNAVQEIVDDVFYTILEANDYMSADAKERIEEITRRANQRSLLEGVSRKQATKDAIAELTQSQITGIVAKNGANIPADKYISGVIHYHQRKAHVEGSINRMMENDQDLVYVNSVGITCEMCATYQGRVYSISGNDSRFPRLERRPPYHSYCVHSTSAWNEAYHDELEIKKMLKTSGRPFSDNRTEASIREYEERQKEKSHKNETRKQWIRYKARLTDLPDLRIFASHKARNTKLYQEWMEDYRKIGLEIKERG
jgi:hypothetical protein